jgi:hypothetical protein
MRPKHQHRSSQQQKKAEIRWIELQLAQLEERHGRE